MAQAPCASKKTSSVFVVGSPLHFPFPPLFFKEQLEGDAIEIRPHSAWRHFSFRPRSVPSFLFFSLSIVTLLDV